MRRQLRGSFRRQYNHSKILEVLIPGDALWRAKGSLAAPSEMLHQTASYVPVDLPVGCDRIPDRKVTGPTFQLPVEFVDQNRNRLEALMTIRHFMQLLPLLLQRLLRRIQVQVFLRSPLQVHDVPERVS